MLNSFKLILCTITGIGELMFLKGYSPEMPSKITAVAWSFPTVQVLPSSLLVQSQSSQTKQTNCNNPQTQSAINYCAALSAESADKKLNEVYQKLKSSVKGTPQEKLLLDSQLAWIKFRDTNCTFARSFFEGGTIAPTEYYSCIKEVTEQRTKQLATYIPTR